MRKGPIGSQHPKHAKQRARDYGCMVLRLRRECLFSRLLFFASFGLWLAVRFLNDWTLYSPVISGRIGSVVPITVLCVCILIVREVLFGCYSKRAIVGAVSLGTMAVSASFGGDQPLIESTFFIFAARDLPMRDVVRFFLVEVACLSLFVIASMACGVVDDLVYTRIQGAGERHSLGFIHPNTLPAFFFFLLGGWFYLRDDGFRVIDVVVALLAVAVIWYLTDSRTCTYLSVALLVLVCVIRFVPAHCFESLWLKLAAGSWVLAVAAITTAIVVLYDPADATLLKLNEWLSTRLSLGHQAFEAYGVGILGTWFAPGEMEIIVDSAYLIVPLRAGLLFYVIALALIAAASVKACREKQKYALAIITVAAVYAVSETVCAVLTMNVFLFLLGGLFSSPGKPLKRGKHATE